MAAETPIQFCSTPNCTWRAVVFPRSDTPLCVDCYVESVTTLAAAEPPPFTVHPRSPQHEAAAEVLQDVLEAVWREQVVPHLVDAIFGPAPASAEGLTYLPIPGAATPAVPTRTFAALSPRPCSAYSCDAPAVVSVTKEDGNRLPYCLACFQKKMVEETFTKVRWLSRRDSKEE